MQCLSCRTDNPSENRYCVHCGGLLGTACARCGHDNSPNARFCGNCGSSLDLRSSGAAAPHVGAAVNERKQTTVLFGDIVESTRLIASLDAEEAIDRVQPVVAIMVEAAERFEGTVVHTLGDGVMVVFGAPRAQEGHALLACQAALSMREAISRVENAPAIRIGLHSGEVIAGSDHLQPSGELDPQGLTIHLANRMQQLAEPGSICLTSDCYRLVRPYCDARSLGAQPIKGLAQPVEVYQLLGFKPAVASEQFRGTTLTVFRGRTDEMTMLQQAFARTEQGDARVIGLSAGPGTGKSRLCYEFAEWCRRRNVPVLEGRALIYGHATPFHPVLEILRSFFRISPSTDNAAARLRIARRLRALEPALERDLPLLCDFLGVADAAHPVPRLDPRARQAKLLDMVHRIVRRAGRSTSVLVIEDLHWLDEASEAFIDTIVDAIDGTRTMALVNFRPSYAASWMRRPYYEELSLAELKSTDIRALVDGLLGDDPQLSEVREHVADRSGGNPFFAEELIRSLADSRVLVGDPGSYRLGPTRYEANLPATVQAVISARIDRLDERDKVILQIGATIGKEFPQPILQQVARMPTEDLEGSLRRLCHADLIQETSGIEGRGFAFRHLLIRESAYSMQLKTRRAALHASAAKAIEEFYSRQPDEFAGLIAHHCEAAGQFGQAVGYLQRAALWVGKTNPAEALKHWKKVRWLMRDQPRSEANDRLRALACGQILSCGWREGMTADEAKPLAEEAVGWARDVGDTLHETLVLGAYGRIIAASGAADGYASVVKEALLRVPDEAAGRKATLNAMLAQALAFAGLLNESLAANTAALDGLVNRTEFHAQVLPGLNVNQVLGFDVEHWIKCLRSRILVLLGRFTEAEEWLARVLAVEASRVDPVVQFLPHLASVDLAWCRGDPDAAERHAREVLAFADQSAIPYLRSCAFVCTGSAKITAGDFGRALRVLTDGLSFARRAKAGLEYEARMLADLADAHYRSGDSPRAAAVAKEAIDVARRRTARLAECHASIVRAAALIDETAGQHIEVAELFERAEQLIAVSGGKIFEPMLMRERSRLSTALN